MRVLWYQVYSSVLGVEFKTRQAEVELRQLTFSLKLGEGKQGEVCLCVHVCVCRHTTSCNHLHTDMEGTMEWTHSGHQEAVHETGRLLHVGQLSSGIHETQVNILLCSLA